MQILQYRSQSVARCGSKASSMASARLGQNVEFYLIRLEMTTRSETTFPPCNLGFAVLSGLIVILGTQFTLDFKT